MKLKTRIASLLFLFLTSLSFQIFSQVDKKADAILKGVTSKYNSLKSLKANFSIRVEDPKTKSDQVQNGMLLVKGQKYHLQIAGQEIISDGKTRWTFVKDANEVQIDNEKSDGSVISPTNIFTVYQKGWNSKYTGDLQDKQLVELVPSETKGKNIFKIKLAIDKVQKMISSAKIMDKNGSIQTITVEKFIADAANEEANYTFSSEKFPGAEVVDLR